MKTRDLVTRLASDISPVKRNAVPKLLNCALIFGLAGSTVLLVALYGVRSDMPELILTTMFWVRLIFPLAIIAAAMKLAERLGRPGAPLKFAWFAVALPIVTMLLAAGSILMATPPGYRLQLMLGTTWRTTTASVVVLSFPSLTAMMHAMKQLAPTRLAVAGAGAGLLAGAQGLLVYSLYCSEMAVPFWGVWYVLAIAITTTIGAAIAPHCLRW
ncbi:MULTISPECIES: DUF1109 domain-containing protein [Paraburkholderia]|jgi:hypothetical protein|uniref:DUF1109 domain-containing protein n=1 Tax=Paraburkholderia hospita TaxID=169430 RepID=A0AAJ5BAV5_9BURK|nr:DUF1109 domain-containing protein [Paraburkholderia hospita]AUT69113.1 DUF1109 domain-containing protein [Paraburkholderia hospita]AXE99253.1 DUF1109 domain-containing protein [Paraburkholderia hospita]OUL93339.1 hypothetical protein CA601_10215 [Paraburkholderia hospita]OUL97355.1 hypothetical protein CA603_03060 [Paraburkholderia hospita]SEI27043.1 hypothetical protein SAMN05192544_10813 [Paraburkholderia hospita]